MPGRLVVDRDPETKQSSSLGFARKVTFGVSCRRGDDRAPVRLRPLPSRVSDQCGRRRSGSAGGSRVNGASSPSRGSVMSVLVLVGRILFSAVFIGAGIGHL